jgi:glycosyltransferase involved in cell wall biosynthesis
MVLFVGRLEPRKGIEFLLKAVPQVLEQVPGARFVIAGQDSPTAPGGQLWQEYISQSQAAPYQKAVSFVGFVPDAELNRLYQRCSVFVAPSLYESFGLVHLEAMSWGAPVVAFSTAATPEVVCDGETGILVEPGEVDELAEAIVCLLSNEELRHKMSSRACVRATQFSVDRMVRETIAIYRDVLDQSQV